jgi:hypothetical protein
MKTIAKIMSVTSFAFAFILFVVEKAGIGEMEAPKNFLKR